MPVHIIKLFGRLKQGLDRNKIQINEDLFKFIVCAWASTCEEGLGCELNISLTEALDGEEWSVPCCSSLSMWKVFSTHWRGGLVESQRNSQCIGKGNRPTT